MEHISDQHFQVSIDELGAELSSIIKDGRERLWQGENGLWNKHAPILFPFAGLCRMRIDGKFYQEKRHGFAREMKFTVIDKKANSITLGLQDTPETLLRYPFHFLFQVEYRIEEGIKMVYTIKNTGNQIMPFSYGGHDSFALTKPVEDHYLLFEKEEEFTALLQEEDGALNGKTMSFGRGTKLDLDNPLLKDDLSLLLKGIQSRYVTLVEKETNQKVCATSFEGINNLVLWHPGKSKMICIEPWLNLTDPVGEELIEFKDKYGVINLMPGEEKVLVRENFYF